MQHLCYNNPMYRPDLLKKLILLRKNILAVVSLCLLPVGAFAGERDLSHIQWEFDDTPAWQAPALYSARVMSMGLAGLVTLDLHDEDPSVDNFLEALRSPRPRRDNDGAVFNLMLHPLWGSETYLRAREADMSRVESFAFSMTASVAWEYLIESWTEHPSSQDLIYTTGIGWMLGEARHQLLQLDRNKYKAYVDPLHSMLDHVGMSFRINEQGAATPLFNLHWSI